MSGRTGARASSLAWPLLLAYLILGADDGEVGLGDSEERLRAFGSTAKESLVSSKRNSLAAGVLGGIATVAAAYLHGRRRGRKRATVLEVERR